MEEYTTEIVIAIVGAIVTISQVAGNKKTAELNVKVESQERRIKSLEADVKKKDSIIAQLRLELKEVRERLYEALKGNKDSGIF